MFCIILKRGASRNKPFLHDTLQFLFRLLFQRVRRHSRPTRRTPACPWRTGPTRSPPTAASSAAAARATWSRRRSCLPHLLWIFLLDRRQPQLRGPACLRVPDHVRHRCSLFCVPAPLADSTCSSMQCGNSGMMLGNFTLQMTSAGCSVTSCSYGGYVNGTILTT